jgi:predicted MPP superfamily phosphohydrolase
MRFYCLIIRNYHLVNFPILMNITRREFLKYIILTLGAGITSGLSYAVLNNELLNPIVERISIPIKGLPPSLKGFRIVQISDIHLKPIVTLNLVRKTVNMVNALQPDLILITGDFVTRFISAIYDMAPVLAQLQARYGVFASLGNHDIWLDAAVITQTLNASGVPVLINQGIPIVVDGGMLWLAGVDDAMSGQPDLNAALKRVPARTPIVLMGHEPDPADEFSRDGRVNLMLTGHSHGGQIRLPGFGSPIKAPLAEKYDMGLYNVDGMWLYVNRGIGVITSVPLRLNCPPEISEFTLVTEK